MSQSTSPSPGSKLSIGIFLESDSLLQAILSHFNHDRHAVTALKSTDAFFNMVEREKQHLDCLILEGNDRLPQLANRLHGQAILLPAVIVMADPHAIGTAATQADPTVPAHSGSITAQPTDAAATALAFAYHTAEVWITAEQFDAISNHIEQAIDQFLNLSPTCRLGNALSVIDLATDLTAQNFLMLQQRRLAEKLKERLGYLGVYYKRNPRNFFRHMSLEQRQEMLDQLRKDYREIVLHYFEEDGQLNQRIDEFVNSAFFTDMATSQVVEIHMDLMDEFAKQLKLEGRSEDILLDYRLTLIDTIAHLCEMYRRSVPREA